MASGNEVKKGGSFPLPPHCKWGADPVYKLDGDEVKATCRPLSVAEKTLEVEKRTLELERKPREPIIINRRVPAIFKDAGVTKRGNLENR